MKAKYAAPRTRRARTRLLSARRSLKMAASAHAYVRGNTAQFYEWLESAGGRQIPVGPDIWICGDCHIGNLGPVSDSDGNVEVQIRDLDQTVIGNPSHDIVRLGLSLAMVARGSDLPGVTTARMLEAAMAGYRRALTSKVERYSAPAIINKTFKNALRRRWRHLAQERLEDVSPSIPIGKTFWPLLKSERSAVARLFREELLRVLLTKLRHRDSDSGVVLLDAAYWVKGCSSLGGMRMVALAGIGANEQNVDQADLCLVDIKQAVMAAAPRSAEVAMPRDNAERVVTGARHLSPHLGERMLATRFADAPVFIRELLPQDIKFDIRRLTYEDAIGVARYLAHVVGRAHWRQMDSGTKRVWTNELSRAYSKSLDAPSWLWTSVVDLVARHEAGYLAHCRKYAIAE
ncbi:MAG: DUF2252 family protein [Rudaea sp.]|nr:DUF2252 family protein [Rudaea sp.]